MSLLELPYFGSSYVYNELNSFQGEGNLSPLLMESLPIQKDALFNNYSLFLYSVDFAIILGYEGSQSPAVQFSLAGGRGSRNR